MNYTNKIRAKHKTTGKVKYFDSISDVTDEYEYHIVKQKTVKTKFDKNYWLQKYKNIINFRLKNKINVDYTYDNTEFQFHHIKPKSIYGQNNYLVMMTVFEHTLAHYYLKQFYKASNKTDEFRKMTIAFVKMLKSLIAYERVTSYKHFYALKNIFEKTNQI